MSIYTDYNVLNINTITKLTESINNDFSLLGKPYNKVEKYVDSNNIYTFNVDFLLNKTEKYELFKQVSKDYFFIEFLLEMFETTVPFESTSTTIKVKKNIFNISTNNDTLIKIKDEDGLNFVSKIVSIDNSDVNFTILELDNNITNYNIDINKNYFLSLVKLVYLDQKGIQFNLVNDEIYKSKIKVKSTIGVIDTIEIFPSPIIETVDLDTTTKPTAVSGDRILKGRFTQYSYLTNSSYRKYLYMEGYEIPSKSLDIGNNILSFQPKSFISGTNVNVNVRLMIFNKSTSVEFSEVILNDFIQFSEVYGSKITTFHIYSNNTNIYVMIRLKNKVLISRLDISGVLIKNYNFNTNIDNFERKQFYVPYLNNSFYYSLFEDKQEEHESLVIENGNPVLYKWRFDKQLKYTFNLDNLSYSENSSNINLYNMSVENDVDSNRKFFNVQTFIRNNTNSITVIFYMLPNSINKVYLKIYSNQNNQVLLDEKIYDANIDVFGMMGNMYKSGNIKIFEENDIIYIHTNGIKDGDTNNSNITIKVENLFNIFIPVVTSTIGYTTGSNIRDVESPKLMLNNNIKKLFSVNSLKEVIDTDYTTYKKLIFKKSDIDGTNSIVITIDTGLDSITYIENDPVEDTYIQLDNKYTENDPSPFYTTPIINRAICHTYSSSIFEIDNNQILFVVPLMKNSENYTYLYVIFDINFTLVSKLYI